MDPPRPSTDRVETQSEKFRRIVLQGPVGPYIGVLTVLLALVVYLSTTQETFLTYENVLNILQTNAVLLVVSIGLTVVLLIGGFDLSVGGVLALSGVVLARLLTETGMPAALAIALVVLGGFAVGAILNGFLISRLGLSFFVITIASGSLFTGLALVLTDGRPVGLYSEPTIRAIGTDKVAGLPLTVIIALGIFVLFLLILRYTGFGRMIYAVGGNPEAARMAGIRVVPIRLAAYAICAGLAALAGVMQDSRLASAEPTAGTGIVLTAAAAVLLGGTSFAGGSGSVVGTLIGTLFIGTMANGLTLSGVSSFWQAVITGVVLILAVLIDRYRHVRPPG